MGGSGRIHPGKRSDPHDRHRFELKAALPSVLLDAIDALVVVLDQDGRIVRFNRACETLTGYTFDEVKGKRIWDVLLALEEKESAKAAFQMLQIEHSPIRDENHLVTKDGSRKLIAWSKNALLDEKGDIEYVVGTGIDITEHKATLESLEHERELFQRIIDAIPVMIVIYAPNFSSFRFNREFRRVLGWSEEDTLEGDFLEKVYPDLQYREMAKQYMRSLEPGWRDIKVTAKDGSIVESSWANVRLPNQTQMGIGIDIRPRRKTEQTMERLLAELDATFNSIADSVIVYDPDGRIVRMNPASRRLLRYSNEDLSRPMEVRLAQLRPETPEGRPLKPDETVPMRALKGEVVHGEVTVIHLPDGSRLWVSASGAPIYDRDGALLGAVLTLTDVTQLRKLQQQRTKYILGVSHGLRTPLTVILGEAQLVLRGLEAAGLDGRLRKGLGSVVASGQRMSLMLRDLVDLTYLETGQQLQLNRQSIDVTAFMATLLKRLSRLMDTSRVRVVGPKRTLKAMVDPDRLERILSNLLSNALRYSDPDTEVTIKLSKSDSDVVISITDQGRGIASEDLPHLFDPYRRAQLAQPKATVGLGLYVTKAMVEAHGGRIWVKSEIDKGSTFTFTIPVA